MARTYEEMMARMDELEKAQAAATAAPVPAAPTARVPAAPKPAVVPGMEALPKPSAAPAALPVTRRASRVTPKVEEIKASKPPEVDAPKPVGLTPDLAKPVDYKQFYDNSTGLLSSALKMTAADFNMSEAELKRIAQAQGVDLEAIHRARAKERTYDEIAKAGRERGVIGFMPVAEREQAFNKLAQDVEKAQRGDAGDTVELVRSGADKGFGPARALGGYTIAGTQEELPEVAKPGEHGYAIAQILVEALQKDPSAVRAYDLYGRSVATGNTQKYIDQRVEDLRKRANIKVNDPGAMEKMAALRKRAINEVIAYKTVGQWTPVVTLGDVEVREGRASPGVLDALKPNIEIIGFNNKRQAIFRQESPMGVLFRAIDIPQAAITGVLSGQTVGEGIQSGANLLEYSLDATKDSAAYVKAPVVAAGFAASILFPDALAGAGEAAKAVKAASRTIKARKIAPEAVALLETIARARKAGDYETAAAAEKELRSALPDVASNLDSSDAAVARFQKLAEPQSDILETDLAALIANAAPEQAKVFAGRPFLHPSDRKAVTGPAGIEQADYAELYDTRRLLDRVQKAKTEYVNARKSGRSLSQYAKEYVRGRVLDVFENLPAERQLSAAQVTRMADLISAQAPAALLDQKQFKAAVEGALKADKEFGTDAYKMARQDAYKAIGGRTETKIAEMRGKTIEEIEAADIGLFDRALKAIEQNNTARGVAAQLLRDEIASTARLRVEPLELFDEVAPKLQSGEPIRLTSGGLLLLHHLRKAFPEQDFKEAYATITIIDKMIEGAAKSREVSPFALYQEIFPAIRRGTPEDLKRLAGELKAGKVPTGGAPAGGAPTAPAAPTKAARARAEAKLREMMRRLGDEELDEIEALLRADGVKEGEAYALDAIKREKARRVREAKKVAATDAERITQLEAELEAAVQSGDAFRRGELEMEIENLRRVTAQPAPAAPTVVEAAPAAAPTPRRRATRASKAEALPAEVLPDQARVMARYEAAIRSLELDTKLRGLPESTRQMSGYSALVSAQTQRRLSPETVLRLVEADKETLMRIVVALSSPDIVDPEDVIRSVLGKTAVTSASKVEAPPVALADLADDELDNAIKALEEGPPGPMLDDLRAEQARRAAEAPTPVVAEEVVEAPAAAPTVEAPPAAAATAPAGLVSAQRTDFKSVDEFKQAVIDAGGAGFVTKQGSVYQQVGPLTQRFKTPHIEHDPKDVGLKKPSKRTIYLRAKLEGGGPDRLRETGVGVSNASTRWLIDDTTNRAYLVSRVKDGPVKEYRFDVLRKDADGKTIPFVEFDTQPFMGAVVLELFDDAAPVPTMVGKDKVADLPGHKSFHPGNQITEMFGSEAAAPPTPAPIAAAAEVQPEAAKIVEAPVRAPAPAALKSPDVTWAAYFRKTIKPEKPSDALRAVAQRVLAATDDPDYARSYATREATARLTGKTPEQILDAPPTEREALLQRLDVDGGVTEDDLVMHAAPSMFVDVTQKEALELGGFPKGTKPEDITPEVLDSLIDRVAEIAAQVGGGSALEPRLREMGGGSVESLADVRYNAKELQDRIVPIEKDVAFTFVRKMHSKLPDPRPQGLLASVGVAAGGDVRVVGLLNTPSAPFADAAGVVELSRVASDGKLKNGSSAITYWAMQNLQRFNRSGDPAKARLVTTSLLTEPGEVYKALEPEGLHPTSLVTPSEGTGSRAGAKGTAQKGEWKINWEFGPAAAPEAPHLYHLQPVYRDVVMDGKPLTAARLNSLVQRPGTDLVDAYKDAARVLGVSLKDEPVMVAARQAFRATPEGRQAIADDIRHMLLEKFNSKAVADADLATRRLPEKTQTALSGAMTSMKDASNLEWLRAVAKLAKVKKSDLAPAAPSLTRVLRAVDAGQVSPDVLQTASKEQVIDLVRRTHRAGEDFGKAVDEWLKIISEVPAPVKRKRATRVKAEAAAPEAAPAVKPAAEAAPLLPPATAPHRGSTFSTGKQAQDAAADNRAVIQTPEFKQWFGDSKVVDEAGAPLVVFRGGTPTDVISTTDTSAATQLGRGAYFGGVGLAEDFASFRPGGEVGAYYLALRNPFDETRRTAMPTALFSRFKAKMRDLGAPAKALNEIDTPYLGVLTDLSKDVAAAKGMTGSDAAWRAAEEVNAALRELGFDGIIADWNRGGGLQYVAFEPTQIKSATANVGTFSQTDPSILKQVSPTGEVKGAVEWLEDGSSVVYLFEGADASTVLHEVAHVVRRNILSNEDMGFIASWVQGLGVNVGHQYGEFTGDAAEIEKAEELFAKAFEQYVAEGKAPAGLEGAFAQLKDAVANIYKAVKDPVIGVELQPEVRRVFDGLFATEPKQADQSLKEAIRRGILGGPEAEVDILTVLSREAKRKGLGTLDVDTLATRVNEAKANIKQILGRDPKGTDVVLKFDTKVLGKDKWTLDDLAAAQAVREKRLFPQAETRMALLRDLTGKGRGKAAVYKEDNAVDALWTAISDKETDAPMTKQAKKALRGVSAMFFGGNVLDEKIGETTLANQPPAFRRAMDTSARIVEQSLADTVALVNDAVETKDDTQLLRYLTGDFDVAKVSGRPILSSGHDKMGAVNRMVQRAIAAFTPEEKDALTLMADAVNIKDPAARGQRLVALGFVMGEGEKFTEADKTRKATSDALYSAIGKLLYPEKQDKDIGTALAAAIRDAVNAPEKARPSHEFRLVETLSYIGGVTARDGELFKGDSKDMVRTLLGDIRDIYGKSGEEYARRVAVQIGAFGGADQAKQFLVRMNLGVDKDTQLAFSNWLNSETVGAENIAGVDEMIKKFGIGVDFVPDAALDVDFYIPRAARDRMAQVLARAQFRTGEAVGAADALATSYRYMKTRMTRGNFFIKQRYFMMNTVDHFNAMAYTEGFGVAAASTARVIAQDLVIIPGVREILEVGKATGILSPTATEKLRANLQKLGDRGAARIGTMMSVGKYRIEVNPILEGVEGGFTVGGKVYRYRDIRDIAVEEGVFSSFDTRELERAILREGQLVLAGDAAKKATVASPTIKGVINKGLSFLEGSVADIAEAWSERERLGAMVTLMEAGYDPRTAAQITIKALFDYSQSMTKLDRHWLVGMLLPFWAFQKNANRQVFNTLFSPWAAYRMMTVKRARERSSDLLTHVLYNTMVDDYGVDVESMSPELQDSYYSIIKAFEEAYGPDGPPEDHKRAMRMLLSGRAVDVEGGVYQEASAEIQRLRMVGSFADLAKFAPYTIAAPSKAARSSYMRDRTGFAAPFPRTEGVRAYNALLGDNHSYMELYWPDSTIEAGMKWHTQVAATMFLLAAKGASSTGFTDLEDGGIDEVGWLSVVKPIVDAERSPILGPFLAGEFTKPAPKRIAEVATPEGVKQVHPMLGKMMDDLYGTTFLRLPAVVDPFVVNEDGTLPTLTPEQTAEIRRLQEQYPDIGVLKKQRYYIPGGVWATAFENSPLGELNSLLIRLEDEPLESQGRQSIQGEILIWARKYAGVDVTLTAPSQAVKREEPKKKTTTAGTQTF